MLARARVSQDTTRTAVAKTTLPQRAAEQKKGTGGRGEATGRKRIHEKAKSQTRASQESPPISDTPTSRSLNTVATGDRENRGEGQMAETTSRIRDSGNTTARIEGIPEPREPELTNLRHLSPRDSRNPGIPGGRVLEPRNPEIRKSPSDKAARASGLKRARTAAEEKRRGELRIHIRSAAAGREARRADPDSTG